MKLSASFFQKPCVCQHPKTIENCEESEILPIFFLSSFLIHEFKVFTEFEKKKLTVNFSNFFVIYPFLSLFWFGDSSYLCIWPFKVVSELTDDLFMYLSFFFYLCVSWIAFIITSLFTNSFFCNVKFNFNSNPVLISKSAFLKFQC